MKKTVTVIGAGVAGLASAIRLQVEGYDVTIYEKESMPGGKMHQIKKNGYTFDLGPSIVMMPELYEEVFEIAGRNPKDYIPMVRLDPMFRAHFGEEEMDFSSDLVKMIDQLEDLSEEDALGFMKYLTDIYERFLIAKNHFLEKPFRNPSDFYNVQTLWKGLQLKTLGNAKASIEKFIPNEKLQQIISFQTLYIGVSPQDGPSLYNIIPMIELFYGVWFIKGGMYTMAKAMEKLFLELGGEVFYNTPVDKIMIKNGKAEGIKAGNQEIRSDYVVCNADFPYAMKHLVKEEEAKGKYTDEKIDSMKYSCSCFVMYLGMDKKYEEDSIPHHFVFSEDLDKNMESIFNGERMEDPSFYVYMGSKIDPTMAPEGKEGLYILTPVSELSTSQYEWDDETVSYYRKKILNKLKQIQGFENIENEIVTETYVTPVNFKERFNAYNGATFGLRPTLTQSNHLRPQAKATHCENLYFTGSSTHPGAGVPIVLLSAKIATEELILDDRGTVPNKPMAHSVAKDEKG